MLFYMNKAINNKLYTITISKLRIGNILSTQRLIGVIKYTIPINNAILEYKSNF